MPDGNATSREGKGSHADAGGRPQSDTMPADGPVRAFLIADIRGYSTFTRERGDETAARLATRFADIARDAVAARSGRVIELRGDEALAVFDSTPQAVRAGLELQQACREASSEDPELSLPVGVGIDCGHAIAVEDGYRGAALNMAARLCSRAVAGQVLVTAGVAQAAGGVEEVVFEHAGNAELKGFDRPVELFEVRATTGALAVVAQAATSPAPLPLELADDLPLANREHELRWLRGTWRQARRAHGRILLVSGPAGIGKTRLAAELAEHVHRGGGIVRYAGSGGAGGGEMLAAIADALSAATPTLFVVDELSLYPDAIAAVAASVEAIECRPVLLVGLFCESGGHPDLAELIERIDRRGDGHQRLRPLGLEGVTQVARSYVADVSEMPTESLLRASGGVPARVHEVVGEWTRDESKRRLAAAAEWLSAGKSKQAAGLEFANNAIALKLERLYSTRQDGDLADACPYKGLEAFEQADAAYFYGRERLVGELAARTVGMGLLGVVGPSGSGKSSVVMAGLLPSLAAGLLPGSARWRHAVLRPGAHPLEALESALPSGDPAERLVLVVDQFEEVFSITDDESERAAFLGRLVELAGDPERCVVVVTIRADYAGQCAPYTELADLLASNLRLVGPMKRDELRRAIELPARRVGHRVESTLVDALVEEVEQEPGGLPLLSTALVELWQARDSGWLRLGSHERTGGVRGAVARLAEASFARLEGEEREAARAVLLRLVGQGAGDTAVRRRVAVSEFDRTPAVESALKTFTRDRLLTASDGTVELAHEALIREWPRLRGWLEEDIQGRQIRVHITQAAKHWDERGRDLAELYRGARLSITLDWAARHGRELNELEREFLSESRQASEQEAGKQRRTNRRLRALLAGTATFLVVALLAGSLALVQRGRARDAQTAAQAQALRSDAERIGTLALTDPSLDRTFLLAVAGVKLQERPETRGSLLAVLQKAPALVHLTHVSGNDVPAIAVSPDGRLLASGDTAGVVHFTDLRTWRPDGATARVEGAVSMDSMRFSPDGRTLAVGTGRGGKTSDLYLVDVSSRRARRVGSWPSVPAVAGPLRFTRMAFSPDGTRIAVAAATATTTSPVPVSQRLLLLAVPSGRVVWERKHPLRPGQNEAYVAFTPQGVLVTSAQQGATVVWDAKTGRIERQFPLGGPFAVSPDGHHLALAQNNAQPFDQRASLAVLDLRTGTRRSLDALPTAGWIVSLQFTQDGANVLGRSSGDSAVRLWDVASGSIVETFTGQGSGLNIAVTPDGRVVLSANQDGIVAAWDLSGGRRLGRSFRWRPPDVGCAVTPCFDVSSQGSLMAESLAHGRVGLVDLRMQRLVGTLPATNGSAADALAFFPDGRTLATGGRNGNVTLWDVRTRSVVRTLRLLHRVWWVAVSPDGKLIAMQTKAQGASSSRVEVRDLKSGRVLYRHVLQNGKGGLSFSPDGRELAALGCCAPDSTIEVWAARLGARLFTPQVDGHATSIAFSPDGQVFAAGTEDGKVVLWNAHDGSPLGAPLQVAAGAIDPVSFSPNSRVFAASSADQTATLWDIRARKRLASPFPIDEGSIPVARFTPGGDLVIDNLTETAHWPTDVRTWVSFACQVAGRDLTRAEWRDLLPNRPYRHVCPR